MSDKALNRKNSQNITLQYRGIHSFGSEGLQRRGCKPVVRGHWTAEVCS